MLPRRRVLPSAFFCLPEAIALQHNGQVREKKCVKGKTTLFYKLDKNIISFLQQKLISWGW
jgi:hypothetical protein